MHKCIVNVGLYRSGTTTLADAASVIGLRAYRDFPNLSPEKLRSILQNPGEAVREWASSGGIEELVRLASNHDILCDGWFALLPFLPLSMLEEIERQTRDNNVELLLVATSRDANSTVSSELQHWVVHDLERQAALDSEERDVLEKSLRERAIQHHRCIENLSNSGHVKVVLPLATIGGAWADRLSTVSSFAKDTWSRALKDVGIRNSNPPLPIEGILLTMRLGSRHTADKTLASIEKLLEAIEQDHMCQYLLVLGIDADERETDAASWIIQQIRSRVESSSQMRSLLIVTNPASLDPEEPFAICRAWDNMAVEAWKNGADWVMLLGDDVEIDCSFHYRAIYRIFLDISERLDVPFGFGCPFWNDISFPGFPTFPCVGKHHYAMFGSLVPEHRKETFVNQDLDPYLHNLYLKLGASPCITAARLHNGVGGNIVVDEPRYQRVPATGWRDFVLDDYHEFVRPKVPGNTLETSESVLLDVVVPSYRVRLDYLQSICYLRVPERIQTNFIVIVDNKSALIRAGEEIVAMGDDRDDTDAEKDDPISRASTLLEKHLAGTGNTVRVRCNRENVGASASRNRGIDESCAEYVLNLDDDLYPDRDLLEVYGRKLLEIDETVAGLVGLVRFPRDPDLPLRHAAVLMSYLTFMFEIAEHTAYKNPAWGVTANILFRRTRVRFDPVYAKTGGGEDVDYALKVTEEWGRGSRLLALPRAKVVHPFWPGSFLELARHFYNWAIGDGALFQRFPEHCYWSFPNLPETLIVTAIPCCLWSGAARFLQFVLYSLAADFLVDFVCGDWDHRIAVVEGRIGNDDSNDIVRDTDHPRRRRRSRFFYFLAHILANLYVFGLECGRLRGHLLRNGGIRYGVFRRFDWHIGRLPNAPSNFRRRECYKSGLFVAIFVGLFVSL